MWINDWFSYTFLNYQCSVVALEAIKIPCMDITVAVNLHFLGICPLSQRIITIEIVNLVLNNFDSCSNLGMAILLSKSKLCVLPHPNPSTSTPTPNI